MKQFDVVTATIKPQRIDDLKLGALEIVGKTLQFKAMNIISDGEYKGQWAMAPMDIEDTNSLLAGWWPLCDLEVAA